MKLAKAAQWLFSSEQLGVSVADFGTAEVEWGDVRIFIALARHGTLSAAARALSINHVTVSRRIRALEKALGERLVERRADGYVLTPAGTRALGPATDMEAAAAIFRRGGADDGPKGLVRVNAPPSLAQAFIVPRLAKLGVEQPGLDIDVATDVRTVSLERRETDIAVRFGRPQDGDVLAKPLLTMGFGFYGSPTCCSTVVEGGELVFVGFDEANASLPEATWLARSYPRARIAFRTNNHVTQAAAAGAGSGLALLPHFLGRSDPHLLACPLEPSPPSRELWLVTRRQDRQNAAIRKVAERIVRIFAEARELFEGSVNASGRSVPN